MICLKCGSAISNYLCCNVRETEYLAAESLSRLTVELVISLKNEFTEISGT